MVRKKKVEAEVKVDVVDAKDLDMASMPPEAIKAVAELLEPEPVFELSVKNTGGDTLYKFIIPAMTEEEAIQRFKEYQEKYSVVTLDDFYVDIQKADIIDGVLRVR